MDTQPPRFRVDPSLLEEDRTPLALAAARAAGEERVAKVLERLEDAGMVFSASEVADCFLALRDQLDDPRTRHELEDFLDEIEEQERRDQESALTTTVTVTDTLLHPAPRALRRAGSTCITRRRVGPARMRGGGRREHSGRRRRSTTRAGPGDDGDPEPAELTPPLGWPHIAGRPA